MKKNEYHASGYLPFNEGIEPFYDKKRQKIVFGKNYGEYSLNNNPIQKGPINDFFLKEPLQEMEEIESNHMVFDDKEFLELLKEFALVKEKDISLKPIIKRLKFIRKGRKNEPMIKVLRERDGEEIDLYRIYSLMSAMTTSSKREFGFYDPLFSLDNIGYFEVPFEDWLSGFPLDSLDERKNKIKNFIDIGLKKLYEDEIDDAHNNFQEALDLIDRTKYGINLSTMSIMFKRKKE